MSLKAYFLMAVVVISIIFLVLRTVSKGNNVNENSGLNKREIGDLEVIAALKRNGSNLSKPHEIEFHFMVGDNEMQKARGAQDDLIALGYKVTEIQSSTYQGEVYLYFDAVKSTIVDANNIFTQTRTMEEIANKHQIIYDGWGTLIAH